jgi:short-subunit dehydrogenase
VARRKDWLDALAVRLRAEHGTVTETIELDLAARGAVGGLARRTGRLDVGLVVSSAGIVTSGPFLRNDRAAESALLRLNLEAPAQLAHVYAEGIDFGKLPVPSMQPGPVVRAALRALGRVHQLGPSSCMGNPYLRRSPG